MRSSQWSGHPLGDRVLLGAEVPEERGATDLGGGGDLLHRGARQVRDRPPVRAAAAAIRARVASLLADGQAFPRFISLETDVHSELCIIVEHGPQTKHEGDAGILAVRPDRCSPTSPTTVTEDATNEQELLEGLRVLAKVTALCTELSVEADPQRPHFFDMCSDTRMIGGPNPDGEYLLAMIRGDRPYRVTGKRGSTAYLGFQVLAGTGLTPRRMAAYVCDSDLELRGGSFALVLAATEPAGRRAWAARSGWPTPTDASAIVVRQYIADRDAEEPAPTGHRAARRPRAAAHLRADGGRAVHRHGLDDRQAHHAAPHHQARAARPAQQLLTAEAADSAAPTPRPTTSTCWAPSAGPRRGAGPRLRAARHPLLERHPGEHLARMHRPAAPAQLAHQQGRARRRRRSVRIASAPGPRSGHWLDTGGRHRGFVILRWLDNPTARRAHDGRAAAGPHVVSAERFEPDRLVEQACEMRGPDDFGDADTWREGSTGCATAWSPRPGSTTSASRSPRWTSSYLTNRLRIIEWRKAASRGRRPAGRRSRS